MSIYIAPRPASISGCFQTWNETFAANIIRSGMENLEVKTRRRTTGLILNVDCSVTLTADVYDDFVEWFRVAQQGGAVPTRIVRPNDGKEIVVRASAPPTIEWIQKDAFKASMKWEAMPAWVTL